MVVIMVVALVGFVLVVTIIVAFTTIILTSAQSLPQENTDCYYKLVHEMRCDWDTKEATQGWRSTPVMDVKVTKTCFAQGMLCLQGGR